MDQSESTAANLVRRSRRRWFQFSLRSFLIVLTALVVWLGVVVNRARAQREAIKAILKLQGDIDIHFDLFGEDDYCHTPSLEEQIVRLRAWLAEIVGDDFVYHVHAVRLPHRLSRDCEIIELVPHLQRFRRLRIVKISIFTPEESEHQLAAALPDCKVIRTTSRLR